MKRGWWIGKFLLFGLMMLGLIGLVTMLLWNWLVPTLFSGPVITFWQALGLLALSKIIFWTFTGKRPYGYSWKPYLKAKWESMSPEDRERFKQKMKEKWCGYGSASTRDSNTSNV